MIRCGSEAVPGWPEFRCWRTPRESWPCTRGSHIALRRSQLCHEPIAVVLLACERDQ